MLQLISEIVSDSVNDIFVAKNIDINVINLSIESMLPDVVETQSPSYQKPWKIKIRCINGFFDINLSACSIMLIIPSW